MYNLLTSPVPADTVRTFHPVLVCPPSQSCALSCQGIHGPRRALRHTKPRHLMHSVSAGVNLKKGKFLCSSVTHYLGVSKLLALKCHGSTRGCGNKLLHYGRITCNTDTGERASPQHTVWNTA